jgi:hypothetical protein
VPPSASSNLLSVRLPGLRAWLDASTPFAALLRDRLPAIAAIPPGFAKIPTRNRMNEVWEGRLDGLPFPLVLKRGWINPVYPLDRRIARQVNLALKNTYRRALELAPRLEAVSFPTVRPLLCWKRIPRLLPAETGILYPKIEADGSLRRYLRDAPSGNPYDRRLLAPLPTLRALARLLRTLNAAGFVHLDPAPQNVLLRPGAADPPLEADFVLIDVEAFRPLPGSRPDSPANRHRRLIALERLVPYIRSSDLPAFAEDFALSGESPDAWLPLLLWLHRHPKPRPPAKLAILLRALARRT